MASLVRIDIRPYPSKLIELQYAASVGYRIL